MTKVTSLKKNEFYLFIFGCVRPLLLSGLSSMAGSRGHSPPACAGFSLWRLLSFCGGFSPFVEASLLLWRLLSLWGRALGHRGFRHLGSQASEHRLSSCGTQA